MDEHGQFDHHDREFIANPWPTYDALRKGCPVLRSENYDGYWLISRYEDVLAVIKDWESFTSTVVGTLLIPSGVPRELPYLPLETDPPEHSTYRSMVRPVFSPRRIAGLRASVEDISSSLLNEMITKGGGNFAAEFSAHMSATTLALFVGLPAEDHDLWVDLVDRAFEGQVRDKAKAQAAAAEFGDYIRGLISSRRAERGEDIVSTLLDADVDGKTLTDDEIFGFILLLLVAGHETTASALSYAFWQLAIDPALCEQLREDRSLIPHAIEEFVRLSSPVSIFARNATRDITFQGKELKAGDVVGMSFASANRDPEQFEHPDSVVIDRVPNNHLGFGYGTHVCLGAPLARLEMASAINALLDAEVDIRLDGDIAWSGRGDVLSLRQLPVRLVPKAAE
jgi:cytochrome P450